MAAITVSRNWDDRVFLLDDRLDGNEELRKI
jgi:hypothetical protein